MELDYAFIKEAIELFGRVQRKEAMNHKMQSSDCDMPPYESKLPVLRLRPMPAENDSAICAYLPARVLMTIHGSLDGTAGNHVHFRCQVEAARLPCAEARSKTMSSEQKSKFATVVRVCSGNFLEMYDFMVFGYYASAIGRAFFPSGSEFASLMLSLMTFGAGFLMRPVGAIVLGAYTDHHGRRKGLLLTLSLMAVGMVCIACVPGYRTIGLAAPLLVVLGRLLQGLSAGVELGGVSVYLSEMATPGHKGFYVSWQSASQQVAVMFAALLGVLLSSKLPPEKMEEWGWRVPLIAGLLIVPVLFMLRTSLEETGEFLLRKVRPSTAEVLRTLAANWRIVLIGTMLTMMTTVSFYLITAYTPTYARHALNLASRGNLVVTLCVGFSNMFWLPVMGALSDHIGRRPLLVGCTVLALLSAYPAMSWLVSAPSFTRLLEVELWLSFLFGGYNGAMVVYLTEIMPIKVRTAGFSLAYSLATAVFGGFTPAISTYLIRLTGNRAVPGIWLSFAAACALIAVLFARPYQEEMVSASLVAQPLSAETTWPK